MINNIHVKGKDSDMYNFLKYFSYAMVIIGAINWGLVGFFDFDLVAYLFGEMTTMSRIVYDIVGISAIISLITCYICYQNHKEY